MTPLHIAVRRGLVRTIVFLIQNGADVNAVAEGDCMPLTLADGLEVSATDRDMIIDVLLQRYGMDVDTQHSFGMQFYQISLLQQLNNHIL